MKKNLFTYKTSGFTLTELTIAMIITSVIIGIAGLGLILTQKQFIQFGNDSSEAYKQTEFIYLLERDVALSDSILVKEDSLLFFTLNNTTAYYFEEEKVYRRQNGVMDTIDIDLKVEQISRTMNLVTEVRLSQVISKQNNFITFRKAYAPATWATRLYTK